MKATATRKRKIRRIPKKRIAKLRLSKPLIQAVKEIGLEQKQEQQALRFLDILVKRCYRENGDSTSYTELCSKYFPDGYTAWLDLLIDFKIVHRSNYFEEGKSCRKYRIDTELLTKSYETAEVIEQEDTETLQKSIHEHFINTTNSLKFDEKILWDKAEQIYTSLSIDDYLVNEDIPHGTFKINYGIRLKDSNGKPIRNFKRDSKEVVAEAMKKGHYIVMNPKKRKMHYAFDLDDFISERKLAVFNHCDRIITSLADRDFNPGRNLTNRRMDTVFTQMHEGLWEQIKKDNGWCEIDIHNSQFAFAANKMGAHVDEVFFNSAAVLGKLYEHLALAIDPSISFDIGKKERFTAGQNARKKAKILMFALCFSPIKTKVEHREIFKKWCPDAYRWMLDFKRNNPDDIPVSGKKNNYKSLSIALQRMESRFMIDGVLKKCAKDKINVLTRHDSIACHLEDKDRVWQILEEQKSKFGYVFKLS